MSVRFIGFESYVPEGGGNYAKGRAKVLRISTLPEQQQQKSKKMNRYRQQLDKQVQQLRKRKLQTKRREMQQDERRQKLFYESLEAGKKHNIQLPRVRKQQNFHVMQHEGRKIMENNPEDDESQYNFHFESRLAHIGKNKIKLDVPVFQNRADLLYEHHQEDYNDMGMQRRRRQFIDEMDRTLLDAHMSIERSKNLSSMDEQFDRLRRRLRTEQSRLATEIEYNGNEHLYSLPYRSPLSNSSNKYRHRRQMSLI